MQLSAAAALVLGLGAAAPALGCTLTLGGGGTLALSADGQRLASSEAGGAGASLNIVNLSLGAVDVIVEPPHWASYPPGFDAAGAELAVAYAGSGVLGGVSQGYTTATTRFTVPGLLSLAVLLRLDNRVTSSQGFASGTYRTRMVVTCAG